MDDGQVGLRSQSGGDGESIGASIRGGIEAHRNDLGGDASREHLRDARDFYGGGCVFVRSEFCAIISVVATKHVIRDQYYS